MSRALRLGKGLAALVALAALIGGIPWALWHFVGWPLPHHVPTASAVGRALDRQAIPGQALVDALAVVVWLAWASLVASVAAEVPAALAGRQARRLPVAGIFQPATGRLVAAIVVAALTLAPRPTSQPAHGPLSSRLPAASRHPVAALALADATLSAPRAHPSSPQPSVTAAASAPSTSTAAPTVYVVQRGDTLWGIAERELGDPLRWSEIFQMNQGRPQPDGATLTDPHWIDPGWTLLLPTTPATSPAPATAPPAPTEPSPLRPSPPSPAPTPAPTPPIGAPGQTPPTTIPVPSTNHHHLASPSHGGVSRSSAGSPVELPSGSVVAGSFAAGVLATVALGRLRRRHAYRYRPPAPGVDRRPPPHRPTLAYLTNAGDSDADIGGAVGDNLGGDTSGIPAFPFADGERGLDPGRLEMGTRDGTPVVCDLAELSGTALVGPSADDIVRAILAALVVRAGPGAAEVLCTDALARRLLPGVAADPSLRRADTTEQVARAVEAERIARTRRLDAADVPDAARFRTEHPENPLPLLLAIIDQVPAEAAGRWRALASDAARLGITVVFLDDTPAKTRFLRLDATRTATDADPSSLSELLVGARLFGLRADEAVELLGSVIDANHQPDEDDTGPSVAPSPPETSGNGHAPLGPSDADAWPEPAIASDTTERPLVVRMLGPLRITFHGQPVTSGLRTRAQTLLAWCLLRPEGATIDEIVDALWPYTPPERVLKVFWRPLGDLRAAFRDPEAGNLEVLEKVGEHYRPAPQEIACDLWDFQTALAAAARADNDEQARAGLRRAVDAYTGDLLESADHPWVEAVRQDLHRRAVDAHLRLAELEDHAGHLDAALSTLERIIELDRYAEEPYRRLMALQGAHGHHDAAGATWRLLQRRLGELDLDVSDATARLYHALNADADPVHHRPSRLP